MSKRVHRRRFLKTAAASAAAGLGTKLLGTPNVLAERSPSSKLRTVVIGAHNQGITSLAGAVTENLVALVDVDDNQMARGFNWLKKHAPDVDRDKIKTYYDYRTMFDEMHGQIDAVFIATPDHHHYPAAMIAMKHGKHVYLEKPMAHSIDECRRLTKAAAEYKVITQLGNHYHKGEGIRRLCEYIWAGAIGNVLETYSWAPTGRGGVGGRLPTKPVPPGLHWNEWIGPAPYRDYHDELHPRLWRCWWDFGDGSVGDWGCHNLDGVFWALKLGQPTSVEAFEQFGGSEERYPLRNAIRWNYPARGDQPPVKVHWYDGYFTNPELNQWGEEGEVAHRPPIVAELEKKYDRRLGVGGTIFVGDRGIIFADNYCRSARIMPEEKHRAFPIPDKTLPRVRGLHTDDFLRACKDGKPACSDFSYSGPLTEMVLLGLLAVKAGVGASVKWDSEKMCCTNLPELNKLVKREHRKGWDV